MKLEGKVAAVVLEEKAVASKSAELVVVAVAATAAEARSGFD